MRWLVFCTVVLCLASSAYAYETGNKFIVPVKDGVGDGMADMREGGEAYADALVIPAVPYTDSGATCDNRDDVMPSCVASTAMDVFYAFTPAADVNVTVDLCGSGYDTVLEIQDGIGVPIACNDDYCGLQSGIEFITLYAGHTYYIIVDGYSTACGSYMLNITVNQECVVECPMGGVAEGEPECGDNYVDMYNGGCNSTPWIFQPVCAASDGTAIICGKSGTYSYYGWSYRDTDWFEVYGNGGLMMAQCIAEFSLQLLMIYGTDCSYPQYSSATALRCEVAVLGRVIAPGSMVWMWVGPSVFSGVSCASDYVLEMSGLQPGVTPNEDTNWGEIKSLFR